MDYANPITAGDVARHIAQHTQWLAAEHRRKAAEHLAIADELDQLHRHTESEARAFDQWQDSDA